MDLKNKTIHKIVNKLVVWKTSDNNYLITDRKQRFVVCCGTLEKCEQFLNLHPYGLTLKQLEKMGVKL